MTTGGPVHTNNPLIQEALSKMVKLPGEVNQPPQPVVSKPPNTIQVQQSTSAPRVVIPNVSTAAATAQKIENVQFPSFSDIPEEEVRVIEPIAGGEGEPVVEDVQPLPADEDTELPLTPSAVNFKNLRDVVKKEKTEKLEFKTKWEESQAELDKYKNGEVVPDVIRAKDQRIQELEPLEEIHNLKMSPYYQEAIIKPAQEKGNRLKEIGKNYGFTAEQMTGLVEIENEKQLDETLAKHFNAVSAPEIKGLIKELHGIAQKDIEAQQKPGETFQNLRAQYEAEEAEATQKRTEVLESVSKTAFNKALEITAQAGNFPEFLMRSDDSAHNERASQLQHRVGIQFGAAVKKLMKGGLHTMPDDVAVALARSMILGVGGAQIVAQKDAAVRKAEEITLNNKRIKSIIRPPIGGNASGSGPVQQNGGPKSLNEMKGQIKIAGA